MRTDGRTDMTKLIVVIAILRMGLKMRWQVERNCERKAARCRTGSKQFSWFKLDSWFHLIPILCVYDVFSIWLLILFHSFERISEFLIHISCFLNLQDIFQARRLSLHRGIYPWQKKKKSLPACPVETRQRQFFFHLLVPWRLSFLQLFCLSLIKVETFRYISKFSVVFTIFLSS